MAETKATTAILKPERCGNCKHRVMEEGADRPKCHEGPPQRALFWVQGKDGPVLNENSGFPPVMDEWHCSHWKPKLSLT